MRAPHNSRILMQCHYPCWTHLTSLLDHIGCEIMLQWLALQRAPPTWIHSITINQSWNYRWGGHLLRTLTTRIFSVSIKKRRTRPSTAISDFFDDSTSIAAADIIYRGRSATTDSIFVHIVALSQCSASHYSERDLCAPYISTSAPTVRDRSRIDFGMDIPKTWIWVEYCSPLHSQETHIRREIAHWIY